MRWRSRYFNRERARDVAKTRSGRAREGDARTNADDGGDEATREDWRLTEIREVLSTAQVGSSDVRVQDARGVVDQARDRGSRGV
jgi:hypothetical protein